MLEIRELAEHQKTADQQEILYALVNRAIHRPPGSAGAMGFLQPQDSEQWRDWWHWR